MSNSKIVRLNASALYALGMDRPTVEALINGLRITGNDTTGITVPELSVQIDSSDGQIKDIQQSIILIQLITDGLQSAPAVTQPMIDESWKMLPTPTHQMQTEKSDVVVNESRHIAEQVASLAQGMMDLQFLCSEVRQIAALQAQMNAAIDELKQGTML